MRYRTYTRKVRDRRARFAFRTSDCKCHQCKANARKAWRPEDYEPDFDGPINADRMGVN